MAEEPKDPFHDWLWNVDMRPPPDGTGKWKSTAAAILTAVDKGGTVYVVGSLGQPKCG